MPRKPARKTFNFNLRNDGSFQENAEENTPDQESRTSPGQEMQSLARHTRAAKEKCLQNLSVTISEQLSYDLNIKRERNRLRSLQRVATESSEQREHRLEDLRQRASQRISSESVEKRERRLKDMRHRVSQRIASETVEAFIEKMTDKIKIEEHDVWDSMQPDMVPDLTQIKTEEANEKLAADIDIEEHDVLNIPRLKDIFPNVTQIKNEVFGTTEEKLAADIDIEEHDVLNNPRLKDIFPNVTQIKNEVFGTAEAFLHENDPEKASRSINPTDYKILHIEYESDETVLLSKPNSARIQYIKTNLKTEKFDAFVEEIGPSINATGCYCRECKTLFPTVNELDAHNMSTHSYLTVAPSTNKTVKKIPHNGTDTNCCNQSYKHPSKYKKCFNQRGANDHIDSRQYCDTAVVKHCTTAKLTETNFITIEVEEQDTTTLKDTTAVNKLKDGLQPKQVQALINVDLNNHFNYTNNVETAYQFKDNESEIRTQKSTMHNIDIINKVTRNQVQNKINKHKFKCNVRSFKRQVVEKAYECNECCKKFSRYNLINHLRTHTGEKPYECNVCSKKFGRSRYLKKHLRTHTGEKPYECNVCSKKFIYSGDLKYHLHTHTGEKPYECNVCSKKFINSGQLKNHLRTHTGEKPYECNVCLKKFNYVSNFKVHLRLHTGEKPYECNVCHSKFTYRRCLRKHILIHNTIVNYV